MEAKPESDLVTVPEIQDGNDSIAAESRVSEEYGVCAICLEKIEIKEAAIVRGCDHAYCTICILRWATYKENPSCPQCKSPFESLNVHRSLDGCIHECMFEENVFLLLSAAWFIPLMVEAPSKANEEEENIFEHYYDEHDERDDDDVDDDDELSEAYLTRASSSIRIGNRRWGDNGYVRAGRKEARPLNRPSSKACEAGSSRQPPENKEVSRDAPPTGRRAKRALKREAANKAAAAKHQQVLQRLGRK